MLNRRPFSYFSVQQTTTLLDRHTANSLNARLCTTAALGTHKNCRHHELQLTASERRNSKTGSSHCPCCRGARLSSHLMVSGGTNHFGCYSRSAAIGRDAASLQSDRHRQVRPRLGSDRKASSQLKTSWAAGLATCLCIAELRSADAVPALASSQNQDAHQQLQVASLAASIL